MRHSHRPYAELLALLDRNRLSAAVPDGGRVLVGVSGGADSVALLRGLVAESKARELSIAVAHIDHGLRPESAAESSFVAGICEELHVPCFIRKLVDAAKAVGGSREAFWRKLRYREFAELVREHSFDALALGHTADDLAETFLFHLARGTGVEGLMFQFDSVAEVEMAPQQFPKGERGPTEMLRIIRPLWKTPRGAVEMGLRDLEHAWINDPSNDYLRHSRNLIRHHVLPALRDINPQATAAIVRASEAIEAAVRGPDGGLVPMAEEQDGPRYFYSLERALGNAGELHRSRSSARAVLPLAPLLDAKAHEWVIAEQVRRFIGEHGIIMSSRQTAQASWMIRWKREGTVALAGGHTLVLTRQFAWVFPEIEPSPVVLAAEHARRFGGFYAEVGPAVPLKAASDGGGERAGDAAEYIGEITILDGARWQIRCTGLPEGCVVTNRLYGGKLGNTPLKKVINQAQVPWYLRDVLVFVAREDSNGQANVISVVGDHARLNDLVARKNLHKPEITLAPLSPHA